MSIVKKAYLLTLFLGCFLSYSSLSAATSSFSTPAQITGATAADSAAGSAITAVYASQEGFVLATWLDTTFIPTYSLWNGTNWSAAASIPDAAAALPSIPITTTYNTSTGSVLAIWINGGDSVPTSSLWNGSSWSTPAAIPMATTAAVFPINATYDALNHTVVATWLQGAVAQLPTYAVWTDAAGGSWTAAATIDGPAIKAKSAISVTYDATNSTVLGTWIDDASSEPTYSVYNGTSWTIAGPGTISTATAATAPSTTYNPTNGTILATWIDSSSNLPTYSVWNGSIWSDITGSPIPNAVAADDVITTNIYNAMNWTILTTWLDKGLNHTTPTYSVWNGSSWSSNPQAITGATAADDTTVMAMAYNTVKGTVLATWIDNSTSYPTYSVWNGTSWTPNAGPISGAASTVSLVSSTNIYNPSTGTTLVLWISSGSHIPTYSVYTQR